MKTATSTGETYCSRVSCRYDIFDRHTEHSESGKSEPGMSQQQIEDELERQILCLKEKTYANSKQNRCCTGFKIGDWLTACVNE